MMLCKVIGKFINNHTLLKLNHDLMFYFPTVFKLIKTMVACLSSKRLVCSKCACFQKLWPESTFKTNTPSPFHFWQFQSNQ